jgi:methionyl-tRNA formyltransferase
MVTASPLRIAFFGTPEFAVPALTHLLASRHVVAGVVTQPDRPKGRGQRLQSSPIKDIAVAHRLPLLQPERLRDDAFISALQSWNVDIGVVAAYGKILTDAVLGTPRLGLINVHASLLPRYRGAAPVHRAVMAGETETGVTIMQVVKALDAGPMLHKIARHIGEEDTSIDVERDLASLGAIALVDTLDRIASGTVDGEAQNESAATYAHKLQKSDGIIDWQQPAIAIHNQIRGLYPWPHAFTDLDGHRCLLLASRVEELSAGAPPPLTDLAPGTVIEADGDVLRIITGKGVLRVTRLQLEGRKPLSARDFLAGRSIQPGTRFIRSQLGS